MKSRERQLIVVRRAYKATLKLQLAKPNSIEFGTQLAIFDKLFHKLLDPPDSYWLEQCNLMHDYLESSEIKKALLEAHKQIRRVALTKDGKAISAANNQIRAFRRQAQKGKYLGVGYGQSHHEISGGAFETSRRKH